MVSLTTLIFVTCEVWWGVITENGGGYKVILLTITFLAVGCTVQQSSFYGYTSMLPPRYSQAVMAGES